MGQLFPRYCHQEIIESATRCRTRRASSIFRQILRSLSLRRWSHRLFLISGRKLRPKQYSWKSMSWTCLRLTNRYSMRCKSKQLWIWPKKTNTYSCRSPSIFNSSTLCCKTRKKLFKSKCSSIEPSRKKKIWIWGFCRSCKKETLRRNCCKGSASSKTFKTPYIRERLLA